MVRLVSSDWNMGKVDDYLPFVNEQAAYYRRQAEQMRRDPHRQERHRQIAAKFEDLSGALAGLGNTRAATPNGATPGSGSSGHSRLGDLGDLPPELLRELRISESDVLEHQLVAVVDGFGGTANVAEILVGYWRAHGKVLKRQTVASKLYRMTRKGLIRSVPKRRGLYTTHRDNAEGRPA